MKRYDKVREILTKLPKENLRVCPSKGVCACRGCVTVHGIRESELKLFIDGKL